MVDETNKPEEQTSAPVKGPAPISSTKGPKEPHIRAHLKIPPTQRDSRKLFVGGLPVDVTNEEFVDFFSKFGETIDCCVMFDRHTGRSRGFGFVTYRNPDVAQNLLQTGSGATNHNDPPVGKIEMRGKTIEIKSAQPKESPRKIPHHRALGHDGYDSFSNENVMVPYYGSVHPLYHLPVAVYPAFPQGINPFVYASGTFPYLYPSPILTAETPSRMLDTDRKYGSKLSRA